MDKSKEYIKMCGKALEIQGAWNPNANDWIYDREKVLEVRSFGAFFDADGIKKLKEETIFLPMQDQLQDVLGYEKTITLMQAFNGWFYKQDFGSMNSMEKLWLTFVMKEKFGKIWVGEDWRNINEKQTT